MNKPSNIIQIVVLVLVVVGVIALALSGYLAPAIRSATSPVLVVQKWLSSRYLAIQNLLDVPEDLVVLRQRNVELEAEVARLQAEIIQLKQDVARTCLLEALVDFARESNPENRYQAANVIGRDTSPFMQYIIIDNGSDNGLKARDARGHTARIGRQDFRRAA